MRVGTYKVDHHVAHLLQQNNNTTGCVVVLGVGPHETESVKHWRNEFLTHVEVHLLVIVEVVAKRFQIHVDVLRFRQRYI